MFKSGRIYKLRKQLSANYGPNGFLCDEEDRAIINVGAENYDDIFSPYCYKGADTLSSSLVEYLEQKSGAVPLDYDLTIRFHVKDANEEKRKEIQAAVRENYQSDVRLFERRLKRTATFSLIFVLIGALITTLYLFFSNNIPTGVAYVVDILAWLFIWEGIDAFFLDGRLVQIDMLKALRLGTAKIEIVEFEPY